jgi:hypothetical protein
LEILERRAECLMRRLSDLLTGKSDEEGALEADLDMVAALGEEVEVEEEDLSMDLVGREVRCEG